MVGPLEEIKVGPFERFSLGILEGATVGPILGYDDGDDDDTTGAPVVLVEGTAEEACKGNEDGK